MSETSVMDDVDLESLSVAELECGAAWNFAPVRGVIGVQN